MTDGFTQEQLDFLVTYMEEHMAIPTAAEIAAAILAAAQATPISANMVQSVGTALKGNGTESNKFRSVLVS